MAEKRHETNVLNNRLHLTETLEAFEAGLPPNWFTETLEAFEAGLHRTETLEAFEAGLRLHRTETLEAFEAGIPPNRCFKKLPSQIVYIQHPYGGYGDHDNRIKWTTPHQNHSTI
jgi:hypothetical protein